MRTRYEVYRENRMLRKVVAVLVAIVVMLAIIAVKMMSNEIDNRIKNAYDFGNEQGWQSCIEENNLYERYER